MAISFGLCLTIETKVILGYNKKGKRKLQGVLKQWRIVSIVNRNQC